MIPSTHTVLLVVRHTAAGAVDRSLAEAEEEPVHRTDIAVVGHTVVAAAVHRTVAEPHL